MNGDLAEILGGSFCLRISGCDEKIFFPSASRVKFKIPIARRSAWWWWSHDSLASPRLAVWSSKKSQLRRQTYTHTDDRALNFFDIEYELSNEGSFSSIWYRWRRPLALSDDQARHLALYNTSWRHAVCGSVIASELVTHPSLDTHHHPALIQRCFPPKSDKKKLKVSEAELAEHVPPPSNARWNFLCFHIFDKSIRVSLSALPPQKNLPHIFPIL